MGITATYIPTFTKSLMWPNVSKDHCNNSQNCTESEDFKYFAYTITYSIVFPIGFISNVVALYVFLRLTRKKTANTVFMTNLAISDGSFSLTLPFRLVYYFRGAKWDFPDWFCRWCVFSFYVNLYTSILFLTGLSVLRYIAVVYPVHNKTLATVRRAKFACLGIWIFVAILSTPFLMSGTLWRDEKLRCFEPANTVEWNRIFILNYVGVLFGFVIPFFIILICYGGIINKLVLGLNSRNRKRNTSRRAMYLIAVVLSTFLVCFLPYHVIRTVHLHAKVLCKPCQVIQYHLKNLVISLCMAASNSCFNPLLYYFAGETFRTAIRRGPERATVSSFNNSGYFSSFRRRSQSSIKKSRKSDTPPDVPKKYLSCFLDPHQVTKNTADGCASEQHRKLSDTKKGIDD